VVLLRQERRRFLVSKSRNQDEETNDAATRFFVQITLPVRHSHQESALNDCTGATLARSSSMGLNVVLESSSQRMPYNEFSYVAPPRESRMSVICKLSTVLSNDAKQAQFQTSYRRPVYVCIVAPPREYLCAGASCQSAITRNRHAFKLCIQHVLVQ
jgi:hypothetical protein